MAERAALPFLRQAHGIHAGITARALSLQQAFLDQPTDDVGQRGAVDPGLLDEARLTDVRILATLARIAYWRGVRSALPVSFVNSTSHTDRPGAGGEGPKFLERSSDGCSSWKAPRT